MRVAGGGAMTLGRLGSNFGALPGQMTIAGSNAVEGCDLIAEAGWFGLGAEIEPDVFPSIPALGVEAETGGRFVPAMDHAILAAAVFGDAIEDAVLVPFHFFEQLRVTGVMRVRHQIAGAFPAANVAGGDRPSGAAQVTFTGQKLEIDRGAEQ